MIKVRLIYRNYKPLHKVYESMVTQPPNGVEYLVPPTKSNAQSLVKVYRKIRFLPVVKPLIRQVENLFFLKDQADEPADIYQYLNITGQPPASQPYVVDTEHAAGLISFTTDWRRLDQTKKFLLDPMCKGISCWSEAALGTLKQLMGEDYKLVAKKTHVIYPAMGQLTGLKADYEFIPRGSSGLKLLLVGNQAYLKGIEELLVALGELNKEYGPGKITLYIVSDDAGELVKKYPHKNVKLFAPRFSKQEILQKFFLPADIFIMPTKQETFGMALMDALACGRPVITTDQFACPEIVSDGQDGLLLHLEKPVMDSYLVPGRKAMGSVSKPNLNRQLADEIYKILREILDGRYDLEKMGEAAKEKFVPGSKFSIERRNLKLEQLYKQALK